MSFRQRLRTPPVNLLVIDFKDRRNARQKRSYAAIGALAQAGKDRQQLEVFQHRVARNIANRRRAAAELAPRQVPAQRIPDEVFIPQFLRPFEAA